MSCPQPPEDDAAKREEEKKLGITMCGERHEWGSDKWPARTDQCCEEDCSGPDCAKCDCDQATENCQFNKLRAAALGQVAVAVGRLMCKNGKVMPKCKPPPNSNMCLPKIEYTATFAHVSWACPASTVQSATGPCEVCPEGSIADERQLRCEIIDTNRRTTTVEGTGTLPVASLSSSALSSPPTADGDMSLSEESVGVRSGALAMTRSVGDLAKSVQRANQVPSYRVYRYQTCPLPPPPLKGSTDIRQ